MQPTNVNTAMSEVMAKLLENKNYLENPLNHPKQLPLEPGQKKVLAMALEHLEGGKPIDLDKIKLTDATGLLTVLNSFKSSYAAEDLNKKVDLESQKKGMVHGVMSFLKGVGNLLGLRVSSASLHRGFQNIKNGAISLTSDKKVDISAKIVTIKQTIKNLENKIQVDPSISADQLKRQNVVYEKAYQAIQQKLPVGVRNAKTELEIKEALKNIRMSLILAKDDAATEPGPNWDTDPVQHEVYLKLMKSLEMYEGKTKEEVVQIVDNLEIMFRTALNRIPENPAIASEHQEIALKYLQQLKGAEDLYSADHQSLISAYEETIIKASQDFSAITAERAYGQQVCRDFLSVARGRLAQLTIQQPEAPLQSFPGKIEEFENRIKTINERIKIANIYIDFISNLVLRSMTEKETTVDAQKTKIMDYLQKLKGDMAGDPVDRKANEIRQSLIDRLEDFNKLSTKEEIHEKVTQFNVTTNIKKDAQMKKKYLEIALKGLRSQSAEAKSLDAIDRDVKKEFDEASKNAGKAEKAYSQQLYNEFRNAMRHV